MSTTEQGALRCDMEEGCVEPITHIDNKGYICCERHGLERRDRPCRKLRPWELRRITGGRPLNRY